MKKTTISIVDCFIFVCSVYTFYNVKRTCTLGGRYWQCIIACYSALYVINNLRAVRIAGTIVRLLPVKYFYCLALRVSQGPWTDLPQRVWRAVLVLRESEGTMQNAPFQTCTSEEGCRNQVTGSSVRRTACHSRSTYSTRFVVQSIV